MVQGQRVVGAGDRASADDQAETLVMRLNRGSGLAGLAGVRARGVAPDADLLVVRPLLGWRRSELAKVVETARVEPARDPSNEDSRYERVRIRKALAEADWLDSVMLARSAAMLGEAEAYVAQRIDAAFQEWVFWADGEARLTPGQSDFEATELAGRIIARLGGIVLRSDVATLVARLRRGENASLGGVLARPESEAWLFTLEPPAQPLTPSLGLEWRSALGPPKPRRLARQPFYLRLVRYALGRDPAAADAEHRIEREPVGRGGLGDPAGRAEAALAERRGERLERRDAARRHGGEELEVGEAEVEPAHDVAGVGDAGQERHARARSPPCRASRSGRARR